MRVLWWNCVGFELWALFVVGHDCGHGVFSKNSLVNFIVGHVAHTPLLVPFWGWRQSHHAHHSYHNDLVRDKAWKPIEKSHYELWASSVLPGWLYRVFRFTPLMFLLFPYYLVAPTGELSYGSHYNPFNREIFPNTTDSAKGAVGTVSILAFLWGVYRVCAAYSGLTTVGGVLGVMADWYLMPYMIFTAWLSFTTYMHHSSPDSVFFRSNTEVNKWTFAKGAETTIDRSFGPVLDYLMHHIGTHFLHHCFFTSLPHYSLQKATEAAAPVAGAFFKKDDRNPFVAYFQDRRHCIVVPDTGSKITFIKDKKHL
jgi:omega-3 fatty acid desaturase (delta-15 desaturase)